MPYLSGSFKHLAQSMSLCLILVESPLLVSSSRVATLRMSSSPSSPPPPPLPPGPPPPRECRPLLGEYMLFADAGLWSSGVDHLVWRELGLHHDRH